MMVASLKVTGTTDGLPPVKLKELPDTVMTAPVSGVS